MRFCAGSLTAAIALLRLTSLTTSCYNLSLITCMWVQLKIPSYYLHNMQEQRLLTSLRKYSDFHPSWWVPNTDPRPASTGIVFSTTHAADGRSSCVQALVGTKTLVAGACGIKTGKTFASSIEYITLKGGSMDKLMSNSAQSEVCVRAKGMLRVLFTGDM